MTMRLFGDYIKKIRKDKMTQRELAEKLSVSFPYLSKLENNLEKYPSDQLLLKLSEVLLEEEAEVFYNAGRVPKALQAFILDNKSLFKILYEASKQNADLLDIKEVKEKTAAREQLLSAYIEASTHVTLLVDPITGEIAHSNPAASAFYEYTQAEMRSRRIMDLNIMSEDEIRLKMAEAVHLKNNQFRFEHRIKSGKIKPVSVVSSPIHIDGKKYLHSIIKPTH